MKKNLIVIFLVSILSSLQAQYFRKVTYQPEMYLGFSGGLNSYWGEGFTTYLRTMPVSSLGGIGNFVVGYKFSPLIEMQLLAGYVTHSWPDNRRKDSIQTFSAQNLTVDVLWNISNAISYKNARSFTLYVVGGLGIAYRNPLTNLPNPLLSPILRGGLQGTFPLNNAFNLNFSGIVNFVTDAYNGYPTTGFDGTPFDLYPALTVGLTYHFITLKRCRYKLIQIKGW